MNDDIHLTETCIDTVQVYGGQFLDVRRDAVRLPDGATTTREYVRHPGAVVVVPLLDDGRLLLERQFRYPLGRVMLEFPAGKVDPAEDRWRCARRELAEETGYRAAEWARAGELHNAAAYSNEMIEIWFARGLRCGERQLDHGELIDLCAFDEAELNRLAGRGELTDAKTLIALLWLARWRTGQWPLQWQAAPQDATAVAQTGGSSE